MSFKQPHPPRRLSHPRIWLVTLVLTLAGCGGQSAPAPAPANQNSSDNSANSSPRDKKSSVESGRGSSRSITTLAKFRELATASGVDFVYRDGQEAGRFAILESLGGGVALFDYDLDGRIDLYFTGGGGYSEDYVPQGRPGALFRNLSDWKFVNTTKSAGLDVARSYSHGVSAGDFDSDGFPDLAITGYGGLTLYRNRGDGTFDEQTSAAQLDEALWSSSSAWADFNGDGHLDLFVAHYVDWSPENDPHCPGPNSEHTREICSPRRFKGLPDSLYFNNGDGTFRDVSADWGLRRSGTDDEFQDKGLGVVVADVDLDGDVDVYVGNDTVPNFFYLNDHGRMTEIALKSGTALSDRGVPDGSMGVDVVDFNLDGRPDIWVVNYERESIALYRQEQVGKNPENVFFTHVSQMTGVTNAGGLYVGWGTAFFDFDRDGDEDALVSNGHVIRYPTNSEIAQPPLLLENLAGKRFQNVAPFAGEYLASKHRGRGLAVGDLDGDGRIDAAISNINDPVAVLANESTDANHWISLRLTGRDTNRDAIGPFVRLKTSNGEQLHLLKGGSSYASTSDHSIYFGLGSATLVDSVEIHWPLGQIQRLVDVPADQVLGVVEPAQERMTAE